MRVTMIAALVCAALPAFGFEEDQQQSHWGVIAGYSTWSLPSGLGTIAKNEIGTITANGSDVSIGIMHGKETGGNWSVSFIRRSYGTFTVDNVTQSCVGNADGSQSCAAVGDRYTGKSLTSTGVMFNKYVNFLTVRQRFQLGMNLGAGIANIAGKVQKDSYSYFPQLPLGPTLILVPTTSTSTVSAKQELQNTAGLGVMPLARVGLGASFILAPGLKVTVGSGINLPGLELSVGTQYSFGVGKK